LLLQLYSLTNIEMVDRETTICLILFYKFKHGLKVIDAACKIRQAFEEDVIFDRKTQF